MANSILGSDCFILGQTMLGDDSACVGGGSTNHSHTPTGGVVCGGSAVVSCEYHSTGTGGVVCGGSGLVTCTYAATGSGGVVCSGEAGALHACEETPTGGVVCGGEGLASCEYFHTGSGGVVCSGDCAPIYGYEVVGSGGVVCGGEAIVESTGGSSEVTGEGGAVCGGEGLASCEYFHTGTGGALCGGAGESIQGYEVVGSGGVVCSGEAVVTCEYFSTGTGGVVCSGEASVVSGGGSTHSHTGSGGAVCGGEAILALGTSLADLGCCQTQHEHTPTGGVVCGGEAIVSTSAYRGSGGVVVGGSAIVETNQTYDGYAAVYHLIEQGNGTAGEFEDSANNYDAQGGGGFEIRTPTRTAGLFSAANEFDGNEFIECPEFGIADTDPLTISLWAKRENQFLRRTFYSIGKTDVLTPEGWQIRLGHTDVAKPTAAVQVEAGDDWAIYTATGDDVLTDDCWHHLAAVWEPGVGLSLYVDGELVDFTEVEETSLVPATSGSYIGRVDNTQYAQAKLQEVRIAPLVREAEWLLADHEAICDTEFYSVGEIMTPVYNLGE